MWDALALNRAGMALDLISWRKAVTLWSLGRAVVISEYEDQYLHSARMTMRMPSIVQCLDVKTMPRNYTQVLPLTRRNLWLRDGGRCVYCEAKVTLNSFTIDHVLPRSQGGTSSWDNLVTSCQSCNNRKGNRRLKPNELAQMHHPFVPKLTRAAPRTLVEKLSFRVPHPSWSDYIYWSVDKAA
jgi:5-methylcytosine-specific restriction endonuclease McrA